MTPSGNKPEIRLQMGELINIFNDVMFQCTVAVTKPGVYTVDEAVKFGDYTTYIKRYNTLQTYGKYLYNTWYYTDRK